jgi:transcriptional regulator NrdR family protein
MKCIKCDGVTEVTTTYQNENNTTKRRRQCTVCGFRFTTRERPEKEETVERAVLSLRKVDISTPPVV